MYLEKMVTVINKAYDFCQKLKGCVKLNIFQ